jgi:hypothetical protein
MNSQNQKQRIITSLQRYVKHREHMMVKGMCYKNTGKLKSISKIRNYLEFNKSKPLISLCRAVLLIENEIRNILPGRQSKFYQSTVQKIDALIDECRTEINKAPQNQ